MATGDHIAPVLGAGLAFMLAGVALLFQELGMLVVSWSLVLPVILIVVGVVTAIAGAAGAARSRRRAISGTLPLPGDPHDRARW